VYKDDETGRRHTVGTLLSLLNTAWLNAHLGTAPETCSFNIYYCNSYYYYYYYYYSYDDYYYYYYLYYYCLVRRPRFVKLLIKSACKRIDGPDDFCMCPIVFVVCMRIVSAFFVASTGRGQMFVYA
jgi:hypothetical protein